jgi:peptide/nickel transport system ATP-binding protein
LGRCGGQGTDHDDGRGDGEHGLVTALAEAPITRPLTEPSAPPLLEVEELSKDFDVPPGVRRRERGTVHAVRGVSFAIEAGTTAALVGESGCGKSTTARMILLLERPTSGSILFEGEDITRLKGSALRHYKRSVQAVFQDPFSSLSPRMRVRDIVGEPLQIHERLSGGGLERRVASLLEQVGLNPAKASYYPHQFSGGQRQRIAIARALSLNPKLIVLDEPVSALDVSIRAQILNLLSDLQGEFGLAYLLISHDLAIVQHMSHHVVVMYAGRVVETAPQEQLYAAPTHPYTEALMSAVPSIDPDVPLRNIVGGEVADPLSAPMGCPFHPRCPLRLALGKPGVCHEVEPALLQVDVAHRAACHFRGPGALAVAPETMTA